MAASSYVSATVSVIVAIAEFWSAPAAAHSWYPTECCRGFDCAPVESATWILSDDGRPPQLLVKSTRGTALIPYNMRPRESKDNLMHVCMNYDMFGDFKVLCFFVPPSI